VPISTIPSKWFERTKKQVSRWETTNEQAEEGGRLWASLVRIPTEDMINESENDDRGMIVVQQVVTIMSMCNVSTRRSNSY
jgi:hypothetical protein